MRERKPEQQSHNRNAYAPRDRSWPAHFQNLTSGACWAFSEIVKVSRGLASG
jgi:hypothetical protein